MSLTVSTNTAATTTIDENYSKLVQDAIVDEASFEMQFSNNITLYDSLSTALSEEDGVQYGTLPSTQEIIEPFNMDDLLQTYNNANVDNTLTLTVSQEEIVHHEQYQTLSTPNQYIDEDVVIEKLSTFTPQQPTLKVSIPISTIRSGKTMDLLSAQLSSQDSDTDSDSTDSDSSSEDEAIEPSPTSAMNSNNTEEFNRDDLQIEHASFSKNNRTYNNITLNQKAPSKDRRSDRIVPPKRSSSAVILQKVEPRKKDCTTCVIPAFFQKKLKSNKKGASILTPYVHQYAKLPNKKVDDIPIQQVIFDTVTQENDTTLVYDPSWDLVSLYDIINSLNNDNIKSGVVQNIMIGTTFGRALRNLSLYHKSQCQYFRSMVNNASLTPNTYNLVYGAVPSMAWDYVAYILMKKYRFKPSKESHKIVEGELEIGAYVYTLLSSMDLVKWKGDIARQNLKHLLLYACTGIPDKNLRLQVLAYGDFNNPKKISAETMLLIKRDYSTIISSLRTISDSEISAKYIAAWNFFMYKCDVHHYLCPHTLVEVKKGISIIAKELVDKYKTVKMEEHDTSGIFYSIEETKNYFNFLPHIKTATHQSMKMVQMELCSLSTHIIKMFADHLVKYGIFPNTTKITVDHVYGFMENNSKIISANNHNIQIQISEQKFATIKNIIMLKMQQHRSEFNIEKMVSIDKLACLQLMYAVNMIILKRVEMLIFIEDRDVCIGRAICDELKTIFDEEEFTSIDKRDAWYRGNDDYKEVGESDFSSDGEDSCSSDSSSSDDDSDTDSDECENLNVDEIYVAPPMVDLKSKKHKASSSTVEESADGSKKRITHRNYKAISTNTPYQMDSANIPRTKCTMCAKRRTSKAVNIGENIEVPCCVNCYRLLVIDYNSTTQTIDHASLCIRIQNLYAIPLCFDNNDKFIDDANFNKKPSRSIYNRKSTEVRPVKRKLSNDEKKVSSKKPKLSKTEVEDEDSVVQKKLKRHSKSKSAKQEDKPQDNNNDAEQRSKQHRDDKKIDKDDKMSKSRKREHSRDKQEKDGGVVAAKIKHREDDKHKKSSKKESSVYRDGEDKKKPFKNPSHKSPNKVKFLDSHSSFEDHLQFDKYIKSGHRKKDLGKNKISSSSSSTKKRSMKSDD